jgi:oligopeptide/dipeptide ABC transporter ATP-binding protein
VPTLDSDQPYTRVKLRGQLPSPSAPPSGCRFHTRCPLYLGDICKLQEPPWHQAPDGNKYRCHIPPDELLLKEQRLRSEPPESTAGARPAE